MEISVDCVDNGAASCDYVVQQRKKRLGLPRLRKEARSCRERRRSIRLEWLSLVSGLLLAAVILSGCENAIAVPDVRPADVDVAPVLVKRIRYWDEFNGQISAIGLVEIRPRVSGYVDRVNYKEGDEVRQGDLLFSIDPRPYRAAVDLSLIHI